MNKHLYRIFSLIMVLALMVVALPAQSTRAISNTVVISQVYGGGGNSGAPLTNDYIELFNRGTSTVSLDNWSLQYASATGSGNFGSTATQITLLSGSLDSGQYLLVQEAAGSGSPAPLPTPDVTDSTPINMAAGGGKVALVNTTTPLGCNGGSTPCSPGALATIVDLVGLDGANFYEGSSAGPATSNTTAAFRAIGGCQATDDNSADFTTDLPDPRNTASPFNVCPLDFPPSVSSTTPADGDTSIAVDTNLTINFSEPVNVTGAWFTISCASSGSHTAVVTGGPPRLTPHPDVSFSHK